MNTQKIHTFDSSFKSSEIIYISVFLYLREGVVAGGGGLNYVNRRRILCSIIIVIPEIREGRIPG